MQLFKELKPIKESPSDWDEVEERIKRIFRELLYVPLLRTIGEGPRGVLSNSYNNLLAAIRSGKLTYGAGAFSGNFTSATSRQLKQLGAKWDQKQGVFRITKDQLPYDIKEAISLSQAAMRGKLKKMDRILSQNLPAEIADSVKLSDLFDDSLWKVQKQVAKTLEGITVTPKLTEKQSKRIADEWQNNMQLWIKDFTAEEIVRLRKDIHRAVMSGTRNDSVTRMIQKSYGVTARKAKFLARQETSLLMTKFKETRYTEAGITQYRWGCVAGSKLHPVRPAHKRLEGHIFRWDDPPITTEPGEPERRNNPGEDYNCRCFARPLVNFREQSANAS